MVAKGFVHRTLLPVLIAGGVWVSSWILYGQVSWRLGIPWLQEIVALVTMLGLFGSVGLGASLVYPWTRFRGAGRAERIIASLVVPFLWATKEVFRVSEAFSVAEALYFYANPLVVATFLGAAAQMGLWELIYRRVVRGRGEQIPALSIPAMAALGIGGFTVAFIFFWGFGEHSFYIFQEGYKALFWNGTAP